MRMFVAIDLSLQAGDVRLALNDLLLGVSHVFVLLYLGLNCFDFVLDGFAKLFEELDSVMNIFVFALLQFGNVGLDVSMVEGRGP